MIMTFPNAQALRETNQGLRDAKRQRDEEIHAAAAPAALLYYIEIIVYYSI